MKASAKTSITRQLLVTLRRDHVITTPDTIEKYRLLKEQLIKAYKGLEPFRDSFTTSEETLYSIDQQIAMIEDYLEKHEK